MSAQPPSYEDATGRSTPSINVTAAPAQSSSSAQNTGAHTHTHGPNHNEFEDDSSDDGMDSDGLLHPLKDDVEGRKSMDDEYRELPEGWIRCFDKKYVPVHPSLDKMLKPLCSTNHHFYVDTKTERSTWLHPYDDPVYIQSLPDTHPANPNSEAARAARARHEEITRAAQQKQAARPSSSSAGSSSNRTSGGRQDVHAAAQAAMGNGHSQAAPAERSIGGKLKDKLLGSTKEERRRAKERQKEEDRVRFRSSHLCFASTA